jgi:hypothetical protein
MGATTAIKTKWAFGRVARLVGAGIIIIPADRYLGLTGTDLSKKA